MKLLLINSLKGLKKKKVQMFGIIIMVMLSTAIYTGMNTAIDRLEDKYYDYLNDQNVEDISVAVNVNYENDITIEHMNSYLNNELSNATSEEKEILNYYINYLNNKTMELPLSTKVALENIFTKYNVLNKIKMNILSNISTKYDFDYELELSKIISEDDNLIKVILYDDNNEINKTYLVDGRYPKNENEITILPGYAKVNKINIGDSYKIGDNTYEIVGFTYAPDYIYPLISFSMPIFDEKTNNIVFMNQTAYEKVIGINDNSFAIKYNGEIKREFELNSNQDINDLKTENSIFKIFNENNISFDYNTFTRIGRIGAVQLEFSTDRLFADYFLYVLLGISVVIIMIITKKRIDDERLQIGVLKSLGYNKYSIATSYLVYPIIGSLIGGLLGYLIGISVNKPIATIYLSFYNVPLENYIFNLTYLKNSVLIPMITLSILSYLIAIIMLRKKPLSLLKEGSNLKINIFTKLINKITSIFKFEYRFKYSLAFRSIGKLFLVSITSFCTGMLIILVLIGSNLFSNVIKESFSGMKYKYMIYTNSVGFEQNNTENKDYILNMNLEVKNIKKINGENVEIKEDTSFSIIGTDTASNYLEILDDNNKNIISNLTTNKIIVNQNAKKLLNLEIGYIIELSYEDITLEYEIAGFSEEYMGYSAYVLRSDLSNKLGLQGNAYNMIYSDDDKYNNISDLKEEEQQQIAYVINLEELKDNIMKQMDRFNGSIYIIIIFASIMALVIIAVIANIVVEENKKTISLMKVMGYKNKKISNIVLNIYTPFIVIAYLLSIPVTIKILESIVSALTKDIEMTIPIQITPSLAALGLLGLLIAYYIAISLSKKVLNKIPLAIALKRE
ncbi:MAG: ABC transporter permease [Bacilli bacterium]|nr:ABC transporter permease [Bacilli bacterium]